MEWNRIESNWSEVKSASLSKVYQIGLETLALQSPRLLSAYLDSRLSDIRRFEKSSGHPFQSSHGRGKLQSWRGKACLAAVISSWVHWGGKEAHSRARHTRFFGLQQRRTENSHNQRSRRAEH